MQTEFTLYYAANDYAQHYALEKLSSNDRLRVQQNPALEQRISWKMSRAIKAVAPCSNGVLSHCQDRAVWLTSKSSLHFGIDIEPIQSRDFSAWRDWILSDDECHWLQQQSCQTTAHLILWTLKDSWVKASNGQWADLAQVGLLQHKQQWQLHTQGQTGWFGRVWQCEQFLVACVAYQSDLVVQWQGLGDCANSSPHLRATFLSV